MTTRLHRRALCVVGATAMLAAVTVFGSGTAGAEGGSVTVTPGSGPIGTTVTVTGTLDQDCFADSPVTIEIGEIGGQRPDPDGSTRSTIIGHTDAVAGAFTVNATIPAAIGTTGFDGPGTPLTPGPQAIHAYCYSPSSSFPWYSAAGAFTVTSAVGQTTTTTASSSTAAPTTSPPPVDALTLGAPSATAGGPVTFDASGFAPDSEVTAELHSDPIPLGTFTADGAGAVAGTVTIPADVGAGNHTLVITGEAADGTTLVLRAALTIVAPAANPTTSPAPAAAVHVEPAYNG